MRLSHWSSRRASEVAIVIRPWSSKRWRRPTIFHLIGTPGVGKFTVGSELARLTGAKFVDNHSVANVIFNVLDQDGFKPLPPGVWAYVRQVRQAVLDAMMHLSPSYLSFIFTNYIRGQDEHEYAYFLENVAVAEVRGCRFIPVLLTCETSELVNRIGTESRRQRMKLLDPIEASRLNDEVPRFTTDHPNFYRSTRPTARLPNPRGSSSKLHAASNRERKRPATPPSSAAPRAVKPSRSHTPPPAESCPAHPRTNNPAATKRPTANR